MSTKDYEKVFAAKMYESIKSVIGGTNTKQKLTLMVPGIALAKEDFEFEYDKNKEKGPTVEANESRLFNKLYDKVDLTGADNGQMLPHQYKSALDVLTPKLNAEIADSKNQLRELLLTKYPYKFKDENGNIKEDENTFQEVFFTLYKEYVDALEEWNNEQNTVRETIKNKYKYKLDNAKDDQEIKKINIEMNDEYLTWFETVAYGKYTALNQKMANLLSVFSENDMKILEGILDSGSGGELQEARDLLRNLRKLTPDGAYIYPVKLNPTDWFKYLDTSFTYVDLLEDPNILREKLYELSEKKIKTTARYTAIAKAIPDQGTLDIAKKDLETKRSAYDSAFKKLSDVGKETMGSLVSETTKLVIGIYTDPNLVGSTEEVQGQINNKKDTEGKIPEEKKTQELVDKNVKPVAEEQGKDNQSEISKNLEKEKEKTKKGEPTEGDKKVQTLGDMIDNFVTALVDGGKKVSQALGEMNGAIKDYHEKLHTNAEFNRNKNLQNAADIIETELKLIDTQIEDVKKRLDVAEKMVGNEDVSVAVPPNGFSTIFIEQDNNSVTDVDIANTTVSTSNKEAGALCFKSRSSSESSDSEAWKYFNNSSSKIEIGMNIAKVGIEREWFNPGVFLLTENMYNLTKTKANYILPCFPVAMVIGRDITIKLTVKDVNQYTHIHDAVKEIQESDSYVFYNKASGSKDSSTYSYYDESSKSMVIITKIATPQIIGFYLEDTPTDNSEYFEDTNETDNIRKFIEKYMDVITKRNAAAV
jgi:hypothetical protein